MYDCKTLPSRRRLKEIAVAFDTTGLPAEFEAAAEICLRLGRFENAVD